MLAFSNDYYGLNFRAKQSVELFCAYTGTEQTEALRGQISDVYTYFSDGENEEKAVLARDMLKAIEAWEAIY